MRVIRIALPALVGCLLLLFAFETIAPGLQSGAPGEFAAALQVAVIPVAIGLILLLASVAVARRTRFGYRLGLAIGLLMAMAGLAAIAVEIPYLQAGGLGGAIGGGIVIFAIVWTACWIAYSWLFARAKADFAAAWTPADNRLAVIVGVIVVLAAATFLGAAALQTNAVASVI